MTTAALLRLLRSRSKLFSMLDAEAGMQLVEGAEERRLGPGTLLVEEGGAPEDFFVLLDGDASVTLLDRGDEKYVASIGKGAFVGEIGALTGEPHNATVRCNTAVRALRFDVGRLNTVLHDHPQVREALLRLAVKRSEDNLQRLLELSMPEHEPVSAEEEM
ncbi:MAG: cyclic nucleotide-binding domain-containing protein [Myxococcota bacterium]